MVFKDGVWMRVYEEDSGHYKELSFKLEIKLNIIIKNAFY